MRFESTTRPEAPIHNGHEARYGRRERHRHDGGVERKRVDVVGNRSAGQPHAGEHKGKFADLKEGQADRQRHDVPVSERPYDARQDRGLADDNRDDDEREGAKVLPYERRVKQHADRSGRTSLSA